jgi:SAM-dependent methyltransferase
MDPLLREISLLKPEKILDIGCGCGSFTAGLSQWCGHITAIDLFPGLIERCKNENMRENIVYISMDGRDILFPDNAFDISIERASLHHVFEWKKVINEMIRVSSVYIFIEEPLNDRRNEEKKNTYYGQQLLLEIQKECNYPHFDYIDFQVLYDYLKDKNLDVKYEVQRRDKTIDINEYLQENDFLHFAGKTQRKDYWIEKIDELRKELKGKMFCESDILFFKAVDVQMFPGATAYHNS